ncbi:MAG: S8 family serine peptidase, partial [Verrucomicrobia bacterium]|nr:S8 family serine peptidase [Verrucomicrobiota bacterium]
MKFLSLRLAGLLALLGLLGLPAGAAPAPAEFTAKELAQGYRDTVVLAKPRASQRNTVDAAEAAEGRRLRQKFDRFGDLRVLEVGSGETVTQAMQRLRRTGRYEYVEPDHIVHGHVQPNDPYFPSAQWSLNNTGSNGPGGGTPGADIGALTAWSSTTVANSASNVIVAVVDSGALLAHEDLAPNLWTDGSGHHGASYVSGNGAQTDTNPNDTEVGHGSHVSGIIGAAGNNSTGISGIAWSVKLMELRFLHGTAGSGSISDAIACVNYAISNGAKIINASYGSDAYSSAEYDAIKAARDAGVIFVASAGNDTANVDTGAAYPAGYDLDNIVTVAATTNTDALATYSNYGAGDVDLAAPGSSIYSCWYTATNAYATESGTSMAAPHVSGVLALMRAKFPSDTYRQLINRLLRSVTPVAGLIGKVQSGGRLNLANALNVTDPRPFNDDFASRASLGTAANIHIRTNNVGATSEVNEPALAGSTAQNTLWWTWTAPASANVTFNTAGTAYTAGFAVYTGNSLTGLTKVVDNSGGQTKVTAAVTAGTTYQIAIGTKGGSPGLTVFAIGVVPPNDDFVNAQLVSGRTFRVSATTFNASTESGETLAMSHGAGHTVWYKWVAPSSGTFGLYLYSDLADMLAGVYNAFPSSQSRVAYNDDAADQILSGTYNGAVNSASLVRFAATAGTTYYFQVDTTNVNPVGGDFTLTITDAVWQFAAYGGVVSSPAVGSDGTIYVGAGTTLTDDPLDNSNYPEDRVYALNANGTKKWSYATSQPVDLSSPAIGSDGTVYIG